MSHTTWLNGHARMAAAVASLSLTLMGSAAAGNLATPNVPAPMASQSIASIAAGDEAGSEQAQNPNDPYWEFQLAVAYQKLGRMDFAEPLYRRAMIDGKDAYPSHMTFERDQGKSIAAVACENIAIAHNSDSCSEVMAPK